MIYRIALAALLFLAPAAVGYAGAATTNLSVNIVHPYSGPVTVVQGEGFRYSGEAPYNLSTPITAGNTVMGAFQWEGGDITVNINGQNATGLTIIDPANFGADSCCARVELFVLFNAPGGSAFTLYNSDESTLNSAGEVQIAEVAGLGGGATVDGNTGIFVYNPSSGVLTSGSITPSASGDFLWGVQAMTYGSTPNSLSAGSGWTTGLINSNNDSGCSISCPYMDEYILSYSSTSPISANFNLGNGGGEAWTGIIAIKP